MALVVDDEPLILMDTADIVAEAGFQVLEAASADEAVEFLHRHGPPKLLFTDIQMPGKLNGIELAQYVGRNWPDICIIVASGAVEPAAGVLPANARFVRKPVSARVVTEILHAFAD